MNSRTLSHEATLNTIATLLLLLCGLGCGPIEGITVGTRAASNEAVPAGNRVAQGSFDGQSGFTVSGVAAIIRSSSSGTDIIRLEGVSLPYETGLKVTAVLNGTTRTIANLRNTSGNQNYSTGLGGAGSNWSSVSIYSSLTQQNYATAILID